MTKDEMIKSGKSCLLEQFNESGDSPWLEGWICGYTDVDHNIPDNDEIHDSLFDYLYHLRMTLPKDLKVRCQECGAYCEIEKEVNYDDIYWARCPNHDHNKSSPHLLVTIEIGSDGIIIG